LHRVNLTHKFREVLNASIPSFFAFGAKKAARDLPFFPVPLNAFATDAFNAASGATGAAFEVFFFIIALHS
jgi:hypothetical protein